VTPAPVVASGVSWLAIGFITLTAAATTLGGLILTARARWDGAHLNYCVALGAGFMLAAAVLKMIPVSAAMTTGAPLLILVGYLLIHLVEHTAVRHFHFGEETHAEHTGLGVGLSALVGLCIHSLFDGASIAAGFLISPRLGILLFVAIVLHKAPEGFTIASIILAVGRSRGEALLAAVVVGLASIVGALIVYPLSHWAGEALALGAGVTLYVAASDLIPEVNRSERGAVAIMVFAGVLLYYLTEMALGGPGL
jgi:zinc transporter ZupT